MTAWDFTRPDAPLLVLALLLGPPLAALALRPVAVLSARGASVLGPLSLVGCALLGAALLPVVRVAPVQLALGAQGAPLELLFRVDPLALVLALVSLALVLLNWTRREDDFDPVRRDAALLWLTTGLVGLALAGDLWVSWLFVELCILATAALLVQERSLRSLVAVLGVVRWSAVGTVLAVVGLGLLQITAASLTPAGLAAVAQGSADGDVLSRLGFGLLVLGLAVKAGLFPLNAWGLAVGQAAPARVLALLSGAVPALTLVALARVLSGGELAGADVLRVVGILSALAGAFGMWRADDFPAFLMQLSLASIGGIAVGFSLPGPAGLFAALALLFHFLLIQSALFVLAHRWRGRLTDLTAIAWRMPWTAAVLVLFAASLVGVPPLPGFWAKLMLLMSLAEYQGAEAMLVVLAYLLVTAVEAAAWLRLMRIGYARAAKDSAAALQEDAALGVVRVDRLPSLLRSGPWARAYQLLVAVLLLVATLMIGPVAEDLNRLVVPLLAQRVSGCCDAGGWG